MKRTDIAMIILIASVSAFLAYFVASGIFGNLTGDSVRVKTIDPIDATIIEPSSTIFNTEAINPTVEAQIYSQTQSGTQ